MALFEVTENDKRIYEEELKDFLPDKILDVHTHVWLDKYTVPRPADEDMRMVMWPKLVAKDNSIGTDLCSRAKRSPRSCSQARCTA